MIRWMFTIGKPEIDMMVLVALLRTALAPIDTLDGPWLLTLPDPLMHRISYRFWRRRLAALCTKNSIAQISACSSYGCCTQNTSIVLETSSAFWKAGRSA